MLPASLAQIAQATSGRLCRVPDPAMVVTGRAEVDSRNIRPGDLFAACAGKHADGHAFAAGAAKAGAVAVLASRDVNVPAIVVDDVTAALGDLARWSARRMTGVRIGITGSSGKTSAKDLLSQVLPAEETLVTQGNQNNELGVPLTVLRADGKTRYMVLEMGARGIGHISYLCGIAAPQVAVVLNVGRAHSGEFGGLGATARAKGELPASVPADGFAVLNADDPRVAAMASRTAGTVVTFGRSRDADVRAADVRLDELGRARFRLRVAGDEAETGLQLIGGHHVYNALAAAAVAHVLGLPARDIAGRLGSAAAVTGGRMQLHSRPDGVRVIDDAYNANPDSVRAAVEALAAVHAAGRRIAVIGEMRELGSSAAEHRAAGGIAGRHGIDLVVAVGGADAAQVAAGAADAGADARLVPSRAAARELLEGYLAAGDVVLVKASLAAGLRDLAAALAGGS